MSEAGKFKQTHNLWLSWVLFGLLVLGIVLVVFNINRRQLFGPNAGSPGVFDGNMTLSADRTVNDLQVGNEFLVSVRVQSPSHDVYGTDVQLAFNPAVLEVVSGGIQLGSSVRNGCNSGSGAPAAVLAPVNSETDCTFKAGTVIGNANNTGNLKFGVVAFDWPASTQQIYTPAPLPRNNQHTVAVVRFRAKAAGSSQVSVVFSGQNVSTDANIGTIFNNNTVGDVLATISGNLNTQVGVSGNCSRRSSGDVNCDSVIDITDFNLWLTKFQGGNIQSFVADVNNDGVVDISDFNVIVSNIN